MSSSESSAESTVGERLDWGTNQIPPRETDHGTVDSYYSTFGLFNHIDFNPSLRAHHGATHQTLGITRRARSRAFTTRARALFLARACRPES